MNGIQRNSTGNKISISSARFVFYGPIGKLRWLPWHLIGWDILDFFSATAVQNSTKLYRKQVLNVLYKVWVVSPIENPRWPPTSDRLIKTFSTSSLQPLNGIQGNLIGSKISTSSAKFVFFRPIGKPRCPAWHLIGWYIFDLFFCNRWTEFNETWQGRSINKGGPVVVLSFLVCLSD